MVEQGRPGRRHVVEEPEGAVGLFVVTPGGVFLLDEEEEIGPDFVRTQVLG
jgi:hypothetical protein